MCIEEIKRIIQCFWEIPHTEGGDPARTLKEFTSRTDMGYGVTAINTSKYVR
jgi:hypothetical protein